MIARTAVVVAVAAALAGCASSESPAFNQAAATVRAVETRPAVQQHAKSELASAQLALNAAGVAMKDGEDAESVEHLSYIAERRAQIAEASAARRQSLAQIDALAQQRDQILRSQTRQEEAARSRALGPTERAMALGTDLPSQRTADGIVLTLNDFLFERNGTALTDVGVEQVTRIAEYARANPYRRILVEGHADAGAESLAMSERRTAAVRDALVAYGVDPQRLAATAYGAEQPRADNDTAAGRERNRRVDVTVVE
ncbi:MAG: OmpA family protein [Rhodospirillales bacterium]